MRTRMTVAAASVALCVVAVIVTAGGASAGISTPEERFTNYRQPTGPEITATEAMEKGVQLALGLQPAESPLAASLASGTTTVEVVHSTLAEVRAVEEGEPPSAAVKVGSDAEQTELLTSTVYAVELTGQFTPNVSRPPKVKTPPSGTFLLLKIDAHTGNMLGLEVGPTPPDIAALGPISTFTIGTGAGSGSISLFPSKRGVLLGTVFSGHKHVAHALVTVSDRHHRTVATTRTSSAGGFRLSLHIGTYIVSARTRSGRACSKRKVTILRRRNTYSTLQCG